MKFILKKLFIILILTFLVVSIYFCNGNLFVYHCDQANFTFSILEREDASVLIFEDSDSVFITPALGGDYGGVEFYVVDGLNTIFIEPNDIHRPTYKIVSHKYKIRYLLINPESFKVDYSPLGNKYWAFYGNYTERGAGRTFEYRRSNSVVNNPMLRASFWERRGRWLKY